MDMRIRTNANADELLTAFFTLYGEGLTGRRAERHAAAERDLRRCFEDRIERIFSRQERVLLDAERQFEPFDAGARLSAPPVILMVLPFYLEEPEWFGDDLEDRRVRIRIAERLLGFVTSFPPIEEYGIDHLVPAVRLALMRSRWALPPRSPRHA